MSQLVHKIMNGEKPSDQDWNEYLVEAHRQAPSMTPAAFAPYKTADGLSSYEILAENIDRLVESPNTILDLACGDGHLIQFLVPMLADSGVVVGVDMSEGELEVARQNYRTNHQVKFYSAKAQALPLLDNSVDAIVCHMAFMLMLPVEPVVSEIHRVLKSGGCFSAVIGNKGKPGFLSELQMLIFQFIKSRYAGVQEIRSGDARVNSEKGLYELFSRENGFNNSIDISDFSLLVKTDAQGIWDFMKDMYLISMLPPPDKGELETELKKFTASKANAEGAVNFEFQMRMFTVKKL